MNEELMRGLKEIGVVERGRFLLKSGVESNFYIDIKKAYGYPIMLDLMTELLYENMDKGANCVAAQGHGGIPLASTMSLRYGLNLILVRERAKGYGRNTLIDGYVPNRDDMIWIVDDVLTSGMAIRGIENSLRETGAMILGAGVVIKRGDVRLNFPVRHIIDLVDLKELIE